MTKISNLIFRSFYPKRRGIRKVLGNLEADLLECLWKYGELNTQGVLDHLQTAKSYAYTTIITTLDRLYNKGFLKRSKKGRSFYYSSKYTHDQLQQLIIQKILQSLSKGFKELTIACFVDIVGKDDPELLVELEKLIKQKRKEIEP